MKKRKKGKAVFKPYDPNQISLLPPSLEELIPENHVVRVVQRVIDGIELEALEKQYKGGGSSSYHPRLLLKVIVYGYLNNIYSSRKLESAVQSNIHFMWLAGMQTPEHNTINRFRSERLKGVLKQVFSEVVLLMVQEGLVSLEHIYVDGTKLEANANKYSFVWGKAMKRSKERIAAQLEELWHYAEQIAAEELKDNRPTTFDSIDAQKVETTISKINESIKDKPIDPKIKQKLNYGQKAWPKNLKKYEEQERIIGDRNSYSKTDPDATFMRMKDDHMRNGQLKAAYNWQLSTCDQFILNYSIHQNPTDTLTLKPHLEQFEQLYQHLPNTLCADAGYGSEENYEMLEGKGIQAYVKYNYFHVEQKKKYKQKDFHADQLFYNSEGDYYVCPLGQHMNKQYESHKKTTSGYQQKYSVYQAKNCFNCPLRGPCHKGKSERKLMRNHNLIKHKQIAKNRLLSESGIAHRKKRPADVEAVFGNIKHNKKFNRFMLRGLEKVEIEAGLIALAHNLAKMAN